MTTRKKKTKQESLPFYQKLILNQFLLKEFGFDDFKSLSQNMKNPILEQVDEEGETGFYKKFKLECSHKSKIQEESLARYDLNIVAHLRAINEKRNSDISLKYFQYFTLLFVEYYLDNFFNNKKVFLEKLNTFLTDFNRTNPNDTIEDFREEDLNKIAIWNATGSGKTILMHINYLQVKHYQKTLPDGASYILLTPKESLSIQHLEEFTRHGIKAKIYNKNISAFASDNDVISIIENTKFDFKDGEKKVAITRFGSENIVFVDEGHRGASGDKWYDYRNTICENGFSFEYSATFGQAISGNKALVQEYAKCILFDYSYKYFYSDGYGKDYYIVNLEHDDESLRKNIYLTASLLTYYQQKKLYLENKEELKKFQLDNPLFVFVGSSVNAVRTENKKTVSDVLDILLFIKSFATKKEEFTLNIQKVLEGSTGIIDANKHDIFKNQYNFIDSSKGYQAIYEDILKQVFNCTSSISEIHIEDLKGIDGEIQVRLGDNPPFALINVGDTSKLLELCRANYLHTEAIQFSSSLFQNINNTDSTINVLIGAKKFTEGWNSYRVSTMGLMNIGRSEGSEIIQLFGRGVRLMGYNTSLKRSNYATLDYPDLIAPHYIHLLETLSIFGVRADYMKAFQGMLEEEGVPPTTPVERFYLPIIRNTNYKKSGLLSLEVKDNLNYKKNAPKAFLKYKTNVKVELDCYEKVQFTSSIKTSSTEITKTSQKLTQSHLIFLDYEQIFFDLQRYKNEKARYSVNIDLDDIKELLSHDEWYELYIPEAELEIQNFEDYTRIQRIITTLLLKYFDKLYYIEKNAWEKPRLELIPLDDTNINFIQDDEYTISISNIESNNEWAKIFIEDLAKKIDEAKKSKKLETLNKQEHELKSMAFSSLLYSPFLYVASKNKEIAIAPIALNESESRFVVDLQKHLEENKDVFTNKEVYLIRNKSKKGIGFFEESGFYPDFILWLVDTTNNTQSMNFIDPHGMRNTSFTAPKVELYSSIKDIQTELENKIILNSFILSPTPYSSMVNKEVSKEDWNSKNVLFMNDSGYLDVLLNSLNL